jgi:hypothetical protein
MFRLLSHDKCPPGEFRYRESFKGHTKTFGPSPLLNEVAHKLANFRAANGIARSSPAECVQDIDAFTCQRLGNMRDWCYDSDKAVSNPYVSPTATPCSTCGHSG